MKAFLIKYSSNALNDVDKLFEVIAFEYKAPITAFRYVQGLKNAVNLLKTHPDAYPVNTRKLLEKYGLTSRHINYKRMTIIYDIFLDTVYIHRIVPTNTIFDL